MHYEKRTCTMKMLATTKADGPLITGVYASLEESTIEQDDFMVA